MGAPEYDRHGLTRRLNPEMLYRCPILEEDGDYEEIAPGVKHFCSLEK